MNSSLNYLAEHTELAPWSSWIDGTPKGYFKLPMTSEAVDFYKENGFLVIQDAFSTDEIAAIKDEATSICKGERGHVRGAREIPDNATDEEILQSILCIHFPNKISPLINNLLAHRSFTDVLTRIIGPNVKCMQSMLFIKASGKPGQAWHQDEAYIPTRDRSLTGGWIAMDDATVRNGCLWVIPGSHKHGILYPQEWHGDQRFDCAEEARFSQYTNDDAVPVEVKMGSVVYFNGYLLHRSLPNKASRGFRRSLVNHYMSAESLLPWYSSSQIKAHVGILDNRDVQIVAGIDPYESRGYEEINTCHIRPDGSGGCGNNKYNTD
jgi:ectoine hydroxylase-related dioxygenase (phytanoyl-CoA dioxygenase family)